MDSIFLLEEGDRAALLEQIMQALGCVYICLRAYFSPPYNCLKGLDGIYHEGRNQQTTSHGSFVRRLFDVYREASTYVDAGLIPGIAFASNNPFMKLELHEFQSLVSSDFQLQFYQEAGIKTVVLMGCATGEIELGMSDNHNQVDIEAEMKNILQTHFPNQPPSSSSSSLLSVSVDNSPEYPPLLFNIPIPTTTTAPPPPFLPQETLIREPTTTTTAAADAHDQTRQMLSQFRHAHFPSIECEDAAMTNAILAVLSSPSTSTSSHRPPTTPNISTAFRAYQPNSAARRRSAAPAPSRFKRAMMFFSNLNHHRIRHDQSLPTATQLHHMISERKRREKLNESFQILRSFLPPGTKKDKASVLSSTVEYMSSLKSRVAELAEQNRILESRIGLVKKSESGGDEVGNGERVSVEISPSSSSSSSTSSEARFLDLRVRVRGESSLLDLVSRVIEFLRGQSGVSLTSVESNTRMLDSVSVHAVIIRLKIQGDEFDESGFREGVKRAVDDQPN